MTEVTIRCEHCAGTGSIESSDSTDDRWWDCTMCKGSGFRTIPDRRVKRDLLIEQAEKVERLEAEAIVLRRDVEAGWASAAEVERLRKLGDALADAADGATFHTNDEHADEQDQAALHTALAAWRDGA